MSEAAPVLERGNVRFSHDMLAEVDRGHPVVRIQKDQIQSIALRKGFLAARPVVQFVLGATLLAGPLYVVVEVLVGLRSAAGKALGYFLIGLILMAIMGAWLLWGAFKRGYYLEVTARRRKEKLRFAPGLSEPEIHEFLETVRRSPLGYSISPDLPVG